MFFCKYVFLTLPAQAEYKVVHSKGESGSGMRQGQLSFKRLLSVVQTNSALSLMGGINKNVFARDYWRGIAVVFFLAVLTCGWFAFFPYKTFMGDDLNYIVQALNGGWGSSFLKALTLVVDKKYRPAAAAVFHVESLLFAKNFRSYIFFNIFLEFVNACLVAFLGWKLSQRNVLVSLSVGILFIVSRFSYYNVLQAIGGAIEGVGLFLFLILLITILLAYEKKNSHYFIWSLSIFLLVSLTHERFLAVAIFLTGAIFMAPVRFKNSIHKYGLCISPLLVLIFNYALKTYIFKSHFFEGTGGHALTFDYRLFVLFLFEGILNLVGVNAGPNYLSGLFVMQAGAKGIGLGFLLSFSFLVLVIIYFRYPRRQDKILLLSGGRSLVLFVILVVPLVAVASITIRQEYRWLYAPYVVVILAVAYVAGRTSAPRWLCSVLVIFIVISGTSVDVFYRGYLNNVFFIDGMRVADSAKANIIDKYKSALRQKDIFLIGCDSVVKSWYFFGDKFFRFYTNNPEQKVHYISDLSDIKTYNKNMNTILVFALDPATREVRDISSKAKAILATSVEFKKEPRIDFLRNHDKGRITNGMQ